MPKPVAETGNKNLIGSNLIALRKKHHLSQRALAHELQLKGYDIDKNVITRIETQQRFVTDIEIQAFCDCVYCCRIELQFHFFIETILNNSCNDWIFLW